ncbi:hypothetical protein Taro_030480 [Colocasia esculenta]|uniref:non-specific serine/threonine protein kinase n=1 Tax=Colocasia esculenta TaxID=4460 RepID=A0A843W3F7_COLES|nr:hypothetical protein [Colocasia esculenta]
MMGNPNVYGAMDHGNASAVFKRRSRRNPSDPVMGSGRRKMGSFAAVLLVLAWSPLFSSAADTLAAGQSIADGQTLVSAGRDFELGFFSPGRSKNRYVGIWYHKLPVQTVMWVANRASPVRDSSGSFTLAGNGSLLVLDGKQNVLWSSNTSAASSSGASATLMDSGNFVVASSDATLWQSFDHRGNTFVPGMISSLDLKTHKHTLTTSWKSDDDPSLGNFSMGIDPRGFMQLVIWEGAARRWRTGLWNGQSFTSMPDIDPLNLRGPRFSNGEDGKILFTYVPYNSSYQRFVLTPNGVNEQRMWDDSSQAWRTIFSRPNEECEVYNRCGAHGVCSAGAVAGAAPVCSCVKGYEPRNPEQWSNGNWSGGCVRRTLFQCERNGSAGGGGGKEDGFFKVEGVGLPDSPGWIGITDAEGCTAACLRNCSCRAYAYPKGIGCMLWSADLLDMRQFSRGGYEVFIRLAGSELDLRKPISKVLIIAVVMVSIFLAFSIYISWKCKNKVKGMWKREIQSALLDCERKVPSVEDSNPELPTFTFESLSEATKDFHVSNMLGEGGFGPVYKVSLKTEDQPKP